MKGNGFGDRASRLAEWFQDWNSCEQTIALYSLLSKVSATQARFLSLVLEHSLKNGCDSQELSKLEMQANSSTFLKSLHSFAEEEALSQLLSHLPLLNPGKMEARAEYMRLLPKVMLGSSEELDYLDRCRQLLSLALVHPAFPHEDRDALTFWRSQLDQKHKSITDRQTAGTSPQKPPPLPPRIRQIKTVDDARSSPTSDCIFIDGDLNHTPLDGPSYPSDPYNADDEEVQRTLEWSLGSSKTLQPRQTAPFSFGGSGHTSPLPASFEDGGGGFREKSNTIPRMSQKEDFIGASIGNLEWQEGMKDVPVWLKSLRLHKYQPLFAELNYQQMLEIDESYLESKNVTKGARNKLILCIRKLARRPETIQEIEQDMEKHGYMVQCFNELRQMLQTPIKPYSSEATPKTRGGPVKQVKQEPLDGNGSGDEEDEGSPTNSPQQHSSSDGGSDLEELLTKDFPQEDLPSLMTRAMGKGFSQLMMHTDTNEDNLGAYIKLLDTALQQHEVFTLEQKKLFFDWKQQCNQTLRVLSSKKNTRGGRHYGPAYTMPATPRGPVGGASAYMSGGMAPSKSRSLRGGVGGRNGSSPGGKGMSLPGVGRISSTLPRMSARQLQQPIPHSNPSFLRPNSSIFPSAAIAPASSPLVTQSQSFQPPHSTTPSSSSSSILPPRTCDVNELYMAELCKSVTDHVLPDDLSDN